MSAKSKSGEAPRSSKRQVKETQRSAPSKKWAAGERKSVGSNANAEGNEKRGRGRPTGKRSDPNFTQTTAYVRAQTYRDVRIALLEEGEGREYSELVEELLSGWLKGRK